MDDAPPPGRTRPAAAEVSCEVMTGNHALVCSTILSSAQMQSNAAVSQTTMSPTNGQTRCESDCHSVTAESSLGSTT
ncbi:MAG: hypothetical protein ACXVQ4_10445 [Gaiellaceae bacterium]